MNRKSPDESEETNRRQFLQGAGAVTIGALGLPLLSHNSSADSGTPAPEDFHVTGREIIKTEVTPEAVTVTERKISDDLTRRYGLTPPVIERTDTLERPAPEKDDLPQRSTDTVKRDWNTFYAKEPEWKEFFKGNGEVGTDYHEPVEDDKPYGTWEYKAVDGGYEIAAPMNVISEESKESVTDVLTDNGWTDYVVQHDRSAWNSATYQFETQHKSAATGTFGFLGRHHLRMWEFEGYVSGSGHVDSAAPHEATSYDETEEEIESIFDNASGWYGYADYYDLNNGGKLDHDGEATKLVDY